MSQPRLLLLAALLGCIVTSASMGGDKLELSPVELPVTSEALSGLFLSGFKQSDIVVLEVGESGVTNPEAFVGRLAGGTIVAAPVSIEATRSKGVVTLRANRGEPSRLVLVVRLPRVQPAVTREGVDALLTLSTDGSPTDLKLYPVVASMVIHQGGVRPGSHWVDLVADELTTVEPTSKPTELAPGRFRVPGRAVFAAATTKVDPTLPAGLALKDVKDRVVLMSVVLSADGRVASARAIRGDPRLAAAVREALFRWRFDIGRIVSGAMAVETVLPFSFSERAR